jgi:hypothetical protein
MTDLPLPRFEKTMASAIQIFWTFVADYEEAPQSEAFA